jgi:hypothetical protein
MAKRKRYGEVKRDKAKVNERARFISNAAYEKEMRIGTLVHRGRGSGASYEASSCVRQGPGPSRHRLRKCGVGTGSTPTRAISASLQKLARKILQPAPRRR